MRKNHETGKFESVRKFTKTDQEIVGVGDTREEARADMYKKLEAYRIPGTDFPGYKGQKYAPKFMPSPGNAEGIDFVRSPRYKFVKNAEGKTEYKFVADNTAPIMVPAPIADGTEVAPVEGTKAE